MQQSLHEAGSTFLHRADAVAKILVLAAWVLVTLVVERPWAVGALALGVLAAAAAAGLLGVLARFGRFMAAIFAASTLLWALFSAGAPDGRLSVEALTRGAILGLRLTTMLAMGLVFLATTRVEAMASGLQRLGLPFMAAFSLTLAFRLLPLFTAAAATIVQAQACRGLDTREGGPLTRLRRYLPLLVPLVLSSLRSADGLAVALESRGLGMSRTRTAAVESRIGGWEAAAVAASAVLAATVIWFRVAGVAI